MAVKPYQVTKKIEGKTYTAQFNGIGAALKARDAWREAGTDVASNEKMADYLLKNVIIDPANLTPDDFETWAGLNEVLAWGIQVMNGEFRPDTSAAKTESKS